MSAISDEIPTLDDLRREIDTIDREMQNLLERRGEIVTTLGGLKKTDADALPSAAMRPGREAQIIRRVVARHKGALPVTVLTGLWRGIISAFLRMQYPFTVHVATAFEAADPGASGLIGCTLWDLARVHFGPATPIKAATGAAAVVTCVASATHTVGVVPAPGPDYSGDWWAQLPAATADSAQVVALLPLVRPAASSDGAYVIARADREETGDDITLLRLLGADEALLSDTLASLGAEAVTTRRKTGRIDALAAAPGYLNAATPALATIIAKALAQGASLDIIGGYAAPIRLKDDAQPI